MGQKLNTNAFFPVLKYWGDALRTSPLLMGDILKPLNKLPSRPRNHCLVAI